MIYPSLQLYLVYATRASEVPPALALDLGGLRRTHARISQHLHLGDRRSATLGDASPKGLVARMPDKPFSR